MRIGSYDEENEATTQVQDWTDIKEWVLIFLVWAGICAVVAGGFLLFYALTRP